MNKVYRVILIFIVVLATNYLAQQNTFNMDNYRTFLEQNQDMSTEELLQLHNAGLFLESISSNTENVLYYDSICIKYGLTEDEKSLITNNGFMVSERLARPGAIQCLEDIWHKDMPVYISSDIMLNAFHEAYDATLKGIELEILIGKLTGLLESMHSKMADLEAQYQGNTEIQQNLKDVDAYITVPLKLLAPVNTPYYSENNYVVGTFISNILTEQSTNMPVFSEQVRKVDFSQFKPRGHYTDENYPELQNYFRVMMWLGRIELYLIAPENAIPNVPFSDVQRQIIDVKLLTELYELANADEAYSEINSLLEKFIGEQDNVTIEHLNELFVMTGVNDASVLLNPAKATAFQDKLAEQPYAEQQILSQVLIQSTVNGESLKPASAFMLLGQRFIIDSYVTASVVYPKIKYQSQSIKRMLPNSLDVMAALGNDAALQLLQPELDEHHYSSNMASLRYLIDLYNDEYWNSTIFNGWLNSIRALNPPADRSNLPLFMQSAAWWQQKMNTQLASWTELRHDNILYAKQSYTGGLVCSYPYSYVEPVPEFFEALKKVSENTLAVVEELDMSSSYLAMRLIQVFNNFVGVTDTLAEIASKELSGTEFTEEEKTFLKSMLIANNQSCGGPVYYGWYSKLAVNYNDSFEDKHLVADFHTSPTDAGGSTVGWVKHAGTGYFDQMVLTATLPDGNKVAFIGPVNSFHEYTTENFLRLTDEEWRSNYYSQSTRPDWTNLYLADGDGNKKPLGLKLTTGVEEDENEFIPETHIIVGNYPNPFNPSTKINFTVPYSLTNEYVKLNIYNIQGEQVSTLVNEKLTAGSYFVSWNGRTSAGNSVASGVYIYEVRIGSQFATGKMNLIK